MVARGYPLIGRLVSCGRRHALGVNLLFLPLPVLVFLCFFESASSSGGPSRRALMPARVDPSGRPPSESSQPSSSEGRSLFMTCCAMVSVSLVLPPAALSF
jgi:hypothetical protein